MFYPFSTGVRGKIEVTFSSIISSMTSLVSALQSRRMEDSTEVGQMDSVSRVVVIHLSYINTFEVASQIIPSSV